MASIKDLFNIEGKVAIVTGGSRGIGEMIASGFLANGAKVYITARKEEALITKAEELSNEYNAECIPFCVDLSKEEGITSFSNFLTEKEPEGIDFLINNAGAGFRFDFVEGEDKPKFQGAENSRNALIEDPEMKQSLKSSVHSMLGI